MLQAVLQLIAKDKGRDINRTLVLCLIAFCAWQNSQLKDDLTAIKSDVAVLKSKISLALSNSENAKVVSYVH